MKLIHLMKLVVRVEAPVAVGKVLTGTRTIYNASGGEFEGDRLKGQVLPGGGEWFLQGEEGLGQPDVRLLLQTEDGAYIYVHYSGVMDFNETAMSAISEGRSTEFGDNLFLTQVRFESSDPKYAWLSKTIAVGEGRMHPDCVEYAIHEVAHG
ncbi:MAG: DUF3237 domain-containing protein [Myxococcota bacterium]|nr:hypothetical protein [Spirochaeta sp.]MAJ60492.1 hypothetical protein [Deltaproteobacteria bacterium]RPG06396.1 MAG: DUF3237 domain-containing protein [Proteobacteria bacterium TMED72]